MKFQTGKQGLCLSRMMTMLIIFLLQLTCALTLVVIGITSGKIAVAVIGVAFAILAALDKWLGYRRK